MEEILGVDYKKKSKINTETLRTNFHRLKKEGLIIENPKKKVFAITEKGEKIMSYIEDRYSALNKPWDGKLRIVAFDIPESKKAWRKWLREELDLFQFRLLQKSIYIGKNPLPSSLYKEIEQNNLNKYIFVLTVGEIDKEKEVMNLFKD